MSDEPSDPQAADEPLDDLDGPAEEADAVSGGVTFSPSDDDDRDPLGGIAAI